MSSEPIPLGMKQIQEAMNRLSGWEIEEGKLVKIFNFQDFKQAREFIDKVANLADEQNHHPEISWQYDRIKIILFTHSINALSQDDFILAGKIDKL